jgi:hypothetical protein
MVRLLLLFLIPSALLLLGFFLRIQLALIHRQAHVRCTADGVSNTSLGILEKILTVGRLCSVLPLAQFLEWSVCQRLRYQHAQLVCSSN